MNITDLNLQGVQAVKKKKNIVQLYQRNQGKVIMKTFQLLMQLTTFKKDKKFIIATPTKIITFKCISIDNPEKGI